MQHEVSEKREINDNAITEKLKKAGLITEIDDKNTEKTLSKANKTLLNKAKITFKNK